MKLIIMTQPTFFVEENIILTALFEEGMESLHLFKPASEPIYSERLLTLLPDEYYKRITVHHHFYLREEYGLRGIHLDNPDAELPYGYRGNAGRTCHAIDQLRQAKKQSSYVFLNIAPTEGEGAERHVITHEELKAASKRGLIDKHVYAVGDVELDNVRQLADLGFGGVVVGADLWSHFNIHQGQDFKELIAHFKKLQKVVA